MPIKRTTFSLCQVVFPLCHSILFLHKKNLMFLQHKRKSAAVHSDKNKTFSSYEKKVRKKVRIRTFVSQGLRFEYQKIAENQESTPPPLCLEVSGSNPRQVISHIQITADTNSKSQVRIPQKLKTTLFSSFVPTVHFLKVKN